MTDQPKMIGILEKTLLGYAKMYRNKTEQYRERLDEHVQELIKDLMPDKRYQSYLQQYYDREKVK